MTTFHTNQNSPKTYPPLASRYDDWVHALDWLDVPAAALQVGFGGQELGDALVDVLVKSKGHVNSSIW